GKYGWNQVATRFVHGEMLGPGRDHCAWRVIFNQSHKERLYEAKFARRVARCDPIGKYAEHIGGAPPGRGRLAGLLNADTAFYLPNDMLIKVDRMSMANSLEVRVPFLDIDMVRFCANLPGEFKLHRGKRRKHILRESLRGSHIFPAVQNLMLAAWGLGLGTVLTTVWRHRDEEMRALLGVPDDIEMAALIPLGHPAKAYGPPKRRAIDDVVSYDRWSG
ncbi:MAG: nitroreductase family protein, partial [Chloroflexi bacterium]|nr:nitroreductase family protein [Chloroflexota bacterium]